MATLHVRNVPDDLYPRLQQLAHSQNRSISAQLITLLESTLPPETQSIAQVLVESRRRRRVNPTDIGLPDSTTLIRDDRNR